MSRRRKQSLRSRRTTRNQGFNQLPFAPLSNPYPPLEILSADQLETIHQTSLRILRDIGLRVENPTALKLLTDLRADVDHDKAHVRFDPALIEEGAIDESMIDDAVSRILRAKFDLGLFDRRTQRTSLEGTHADAIAWIQIRRVGRIVHAVDRGNGRQGEHEGC